MTVPTRAQAVSLLLELDPVDWLVEHSSAVAEVAAFLAARCAESGHGLDRTLVETAALLHDVDKALPDDHPLRALGHGTAGAAWLGERGQAELGAAVAGHPATLLSDEERYPRWAAEASLEERLVAYADKRAMQDVCSLDDRFGRWESRHPERIASFRLARERADVLEREVCEIAGIEPAQVERLPWVAAARQSSAAR